MIQEYIAFDNFNTIASLDPQFGESWDALPEARRRKTWEWLHAQIEAHPWLGYPLHTPGQRAALPRDLPSRDGCESPILLRWDTDIVRVAASGSTILGLEGYWWWPTQSGLIQSPLVALTPEPLGPAIVEIVIPSACIAEAAIDTVKVSGDFSELVALRDLGVSKTKTGPLETEFDARNMPQKTPLPYAIWKWMADFSALNSNYKQKTVRLERA